MRHSENDEIYQLDCRNLSSIENMLNGMFMREMKEFVNWLRIKIIGNNDLMACFIKLFL